MRRSHFQRVSRRAAHSDLQESGTYVDACVCLCVIVRSFVRWQTLLAFLVHITDQPNVFLAHKCGRVVVCPVDARARARARVCVCVCACVCVSVRVRCAVLMLGLCLCFAVDAVCSMVASNGTDPHSAEETLRVVAGAQQC